MEEGKLFQVGDVAKLFHMSVGSLHHYERLGLLKPEYVDEKTGYRYYSIRQFEVLNTIRYLRVLDMPLGEIADFLQNKDVAVMEEKLLRQKEIISRKQRELELIERKIDHRLQQLTEARSSRLDEIRLMPMEACRVARMESSLKPRSYLDLEYSIRQLEEHQKESVVFLGKVGLGISRENLLAGNFERYDMVFLVLDEEDTYEGAAEFWPEGQCAAVSFCGSHSEAAGYYRKLLAYIEAEGLEITGFSREITMIDYGLTNDTEKFVTQIRIPVGRSGKSNTPWDAGHQICSAAELRSI